MTSLDVSTAIELEDLIFNKDLTKEMIPKIEEAMERSNSQYGPTFSQRLLLYALFMNKYKESNVQILEELQFKDLIVFKDNKINLSDSEKEINTVNSQQDLQELELNPLLS